MANTCGESSVLGSGVESCCRLPMRRHRVHQARAAELLEGRDRARRQAEADRHAWAAERTALKSAVVGLQVNSHSLVLAQSHA